MSMKRMHWVAAVSLLMAGTCLAQTTAPATKGELKAGDFVAVCGDSITEQKQYSVIIEEYLLMCQPAANLRTLQAGWSGEQAAGFRGRMADDVLPLKPTVTTTCYGMNDGGYTALSADRAATYRTNTTEIVKKFKEAGVRLIVVGSPGVVDSETFKRGQEVYNETLTKLRDIAAEVAVEQGGVFADVNTPMKDVIATAKEKWGKNYAVAGGDGVHPGYNGHLVMAYAFLKALGCDGNVGTITVDLATGKADATAGHKVTGSEKGSVSLESTKYPFCFFGEAKDSNSAKGVLEFLPFNEELNRLTLVAKGVDAAKKYRVTWGAANHEFNGAELAKGVNLAAAFADNPFSEAFKKVDAVVRHQQNFETNLTKQMLHGLGQIRAELPGDQATVDAVVEKLAARDKVRADASRAAVEPVTHTVKIEVVE